jgi:flagellar hook-associated protein 1
MPGLNSILDMARRALQAQQAAMGVTSHNISNASTDGYSRQRVDFATTPPESISRGLLGTGVMISHIGRLRDSFIDREIRATNAGYGSATAKYSILSQVEALVNEPSDASIGTLLGNFFNSFHDLANHPEESSARNAVIQNGQLLVSTITSLDKGLAQLRSDLVTDATTKVNRINQLTSELADLDVKIIDSTVRGQDPSDMKDMRDLKLDELSKLANITVSEDNTGSMTVSIGGGVVMTRNGSIPLAVSTASGNLQIVSKQSGDAVNVTGGEIGGMLEIANVKIPDYQARLDSLSSTMITRVNQVHAAGYGLGTPPSTGIAFFTGTDAGSIAVNAAVVANANLVAASADGTPGNNLVALQLAGVQNESLLGGGTQTLDQYFAGMVSDIGSSVNNTKTNATTQELVLQQLDAQRQSVSGVSLDEEMTNMIQYQRAFDAASKIVKTIDEMYQTVINMKG